MATGRLGKRGNTPSEGGRGSGGGASGEGSGARLISTLAASSASIRSTRLSRAE
jgi:hypothetical protein